MDRRDAAALVLVIVLANGEVRVAHLPEAFYPQPPQGAAFTQVSTATSGTADYWGLFTAVKPATPT